MFTAFIKSKDKKNHVCFDIDFSEVPLFFNIYICKRNELIIIPTEHV